MAEWFKAHARKACVGNTTVSSNLPLSALLIFFSISSFYSLIELLMVTQPNYHSRAFSIYGHRENQATRQHDYCRHLLLGDGSRASQNGLSNVSLFCYT